MAKSFGPDVRVAVIAGDDATIADLDMSVSVGPGWVSHLLQRVAAFHLDSESSQALVAAAGESYSARRQRLIDGLSHYGLAASGASGLNVWVPVADEQAAIEAVREAGYVVRAGDPYRISSSPAVRVTIASLDDRQIDAVAAALGQHLSRRTSQSQ
ncbi:MAG: aminotransferase class I/II-fold pyridoxal phosphate-dependent enzyme [Actinobacteria bacterium]|nr:aminotransferase class I/II-fold pyridoxal phosphate-dependent enzyme [Actinomycetota bacterium]